MSEFPFLEALKLEAEQKIKSMERRMRDLWTITKQDIQRSKQVSKKPIKLTKKFQPVQKIRLSMYTDKVTGKNNPVEQFLAAVAKTYKKKLGITDIMQVGLAREDNEALYSALKKYTSKSKMTKHLTDKGKELAVGYYWLDSGPVDLDNVERGYLYLRAN